MSEWLFSVSPIAVYPRKINSSLIIQNLCQLERSCNNFQVSDLIYLELVHNPNGIWQ